MAQLISIGDFSRMSFLSVKTLRHYHDIGLLIPADVDPDTSYRRYSTDQLATAQVILRLRGLGMPLDEIRQVLAAPDLTTRNAAVINHLQRMERQLDQTRATVQSLRQILQGTPEPAPIEHRHVPAGRALVLSTQTSLAELGSWLDDARIALATAAATAGLRCAGPDGSLYSTEFFTEAGFREIGDITACTVVAFLPVEPDPDRPLEVSQLRDAGVHAAIGLEELPAADLAVTVHHGDCSQLDRSYAALGRYVSEQAIGVAGPIREYHLDPVGTEAEHLRTEVGWPIFPIAPDPADAIRAS